MAKMLKSLGWFLLLAVVLLGVPKFAGAVADLINHGVIDPDGAFSWLFVHHLVQAAVFLALIRVFRFIKPMEFGLAWGDRKVGWRYVLRFTLIFTMFMLGTLVLSLITKSFQPFPKPLTARNVIGYLGFQLLLSGPSEELIFRAFAMTMLGLVLRGRIFAGKVSTANLAAAVIFGLAHVSFSFSPFRVSYSAMQVVLSIGLGLLYGDCYEKSGSVFYPMMMHSIGNFLTVTANILSTILVQG